MKKLILFAICLCFLTGPIYSESYPEYLKRQKEEQERYKKEQEEKFKKFVEEKEQDFKKFLQERELNYQEYWGSVNKESFNDTKKQSDDKEPLPFRAKFSICFNCADTGTDLQVASEDQNGTLIWEGAKSTCEKRGDGWYLPTKEELIKVYKSKEAMSGFSDAEYWSISEEWKTLGDTDLAKAVNFKDGKASTYNKKDAKRVRCVRRIPDSQGGSKKIVVDNGKTPKNESKEDNLQQPKPAEDKTPKDEGREEVKQPKTVVKAEDKTPKDEGRKEEVKQPKEVVKAEDKTPKKESRKEEVKQPKAVVKAEDKTPKDSGKRKDETIKPNNKTVIVFTPGAFIRPVENCRRITSNFGLRQKIVNGKLVKGTGNHKGIDISCKPMEGKSVIAAVAGKVIFTGFDKGYGNYIRIEHPDGSRTIYGHLSKIIAKQGENIAQAQEIGKAGCTGNCTGAHLHFEVRNNKNEPLDPLKFLPPMDPKK